MKSLTQFIQEKLVIKRKLATKRNNYKYFPESKEELKN